MMSGQINQNLDLAAGTWKYMHTTPGVDAGVVTRKTRVAEGVNNPCLVSAVQFRDIHGSGQKSSSDL